MIKWGAKYNQSPCTQMLVTSHSTYKEITSKILNKLFLVLSVKNKQIFITIVHDNNSFSWEHPQHTQRY